MKYWLLVPLLFVIQAQAQQSIWDKVDPDYHLVMQLQSFGASKELIDEVKRLQNAGVVDYYIIKQFRGEPIGGQQTSDAAAGTAAR